jgi:hypothetical protein
MSILKLFKKETSKGTSYTVAVVKKTNIVPPAKYTPKVSKESAKRKHKVI